MEGKQQANIDVNICNGNVAVSWIKGVAVGEHTLKPQVLLILETVLACSYSTK